MTAELAGRGWTEQATPLDGASVRCEVCGETVPADEITVEALERVEGASDPDDMAVVVTFTCPHCSANDVLVLQYGPQASAPDSDVLAALSTPS